MTEVLNLTEVFDRVVTAVTFALTDIRLKKSEAVIPPFPQAYKMAIHTKGNFEAYITCEFEPDLLRNIILRMHGGSMPPVDEEILYINEYVNIICGRAVSIVNNITGNASRLSVPFSYTEEDELQEISGKKNEDVLCYQASEGSMCITIFYTLH